MSSTPRLSLPVLEASQAQKHVTVNEALLRLDGVVQLAVADRDLATPPTAPATGERHLVAAGATGAWAGGEGRIACERGGAWDLVVPAAGWLCWVEAEARLLVHDGTAWRDVADAAGFAKVTALTDGSLTGLGIATAPDATNRLAVKADAALFAADETGGSGDMRLFVDKTLPARDAAIVFETGWSGRALLGLLGDDDFSIKVSADGATWTEALRIAAGGGVSLPTGALAGGGRLLSTRLFTASGTWTRPSGVRFVLVWAVGGGGGGGGAAGASASGAAGGGGGAGGFALAFLDVSAIASRAVTVGAGGTGGASTGAAGGTGGATSFGTEVVAEGGGGGAGMAAGTWGTAVTGGPGGIASSGAPGFVGAVGTAGLRFDAGNVLSGCGAASFFGGGASGAVGNVAGSAAPAPGAGGSGAAVASSATGLPGGTGGSGLVWLWEFE